MKTYTVMIVLAALLLSACAPEDLASLGGAGYPQPQAGGGGQADQSGQVGETSAKGQIETMIGEGSGNVNSPGYPAAGDSGNISSSGEASEETLSGSQAGQIPSSSAGSESSDASAAKPVNWLNHVDEPYKFSIQYPDSYVILPEDKPSSDNSSTGLVHQVRFQDRDLASGDTAAFEPAQFTVEVFTFPGQASLEAFIKSNLPFPNMTVEPYTYGKLTGLRASTNRMLAPNAFYYFAGEGLIYKLTPLGQYSTEMLQSFTILP